MNTLYSMTIRGKNSLAIFNATTGHVIKLVTVDGDIIGSPNVSGDTGMVNVFKNGSNKTYIFNLKNGTVKKIFNT